MPLPGSGIISLQGHSRPGDALHSKPKQAMIVRMSVETLEALQASPQPQMQFEFGKQPGIHIGNSFFSMRPLEEGFPHEIYLRAASASKPNAPLKCYADVIGKFTIQRQLGESVEDRVRGRTQDAEEQRLKRKTILLDVPPVSIKNSTSKKSKDSATARKIVPLPHRRPASSQPSPLGSPLSLQSSATGTAQPLRNRLIHCLAVSPRTTDFLTRMVYGASADADAHKEFLELLNEIAEQPAPSKKRTDTNQSSETWRLKTRTWLDVRPYEWPKLSEPERTNMARQARIAFGDLKIPDSDPVWEHVRYRNTVHAPSASSATTSSQNQSQTTVVKGVEAKKPAMPKEKSKAPSRKKAEQPVMAKDESSKPSGSGGISTKAESRKSTGSSKSDPSLASLPQKPVRRLPGSGFKKSSSVTPPVQSPSASALPKKPGLTDGRETKEFPARSVSARPAPDVPPPPAKASPIQNTTTKRARETVDRDSTQDPASSATSKRKKVVKPEEGELVELDLVPSVTVKKQRKIDEETVKKHRVIKQEEGELIETNPVGKRRKTEDGAVPSARQHLSPPKRTNTRDPSPASRPVAKEPAQPPSKTSRPSDKTGSMSKSSSKLNGTTKFKRGSEIYTSSDDDRGSSQPAKSHQISQVKPQQPASSTVKKREHHQRPIAPLPKDAEELRSRYKSVYLPYIMAYQQVVAQKTKLENALNGNQTDSEGDVDLMDAENLTKLTENHKTYRAELESIQAAYAKAGGKDILRPEVNGSSSSD